MYVVCLLFYAIGGGCFLIFNRPYMVDRLFIYIGFYVSEKDDVSYNATPYS